MPHLRWSTGSLRQKKQLTARNKHFLLELRQQWLPSQPEARAHLSSPCYRAAVSFASAVCARRRAVRSASVPRAIRLGRRRCLVTSQVTWCSGGRRPAVWLRPSGRGRGREREPCRRVPPRIGRCGSLIAIGRREEPRTIS